MFIPTHVTKPPIRCPDPKCASLKVFIKDPHLMVTTCTKCGRDFIPKT